MTTISKHPILIMSPGAPSTAQIKTMLGRNDVEYTLIDPDNDPLTQRSQGTLTGLHMPAIWTPKIGEWREHVSQLEIAQLVGLHTEPDHEHYDVIVLGGGPAGLTAAVYASTEGLSTLVVEPCAVGGQAGTSSRIENYPGFPCGITGTQLAAKYRHQAERFGTEFVIGNPVAAVLSDEDGCSRVILGTGREIKGKALIVATGVEYRQLEAEGLNELIGAGVTYGSAPHEAAECAGKIVAVIGGANSAGQAALHLAEHAAHVYVVARRDNIAETMSHYLISRIEEADNIEVRSGEQVQAARPDNEGRLAALHMDTGVELPVERAFIMIGGVPNANAVVHDLQTDRHGFICVGPDVLDTVWSKDREPFALETSRPGIFALGDVRSGSLKRVASAVGDGALVINLIHKYIQSQTKDAAASR